MSRTYGSMNNSRHHEVTAMSATYSHLRGWHSGVQVHFDPDGETDRWIVYMTSGSGRGNDLIRVGTVIDTADGPHWDPGTVTRSWMRR
jgi:hypothetical protein